MKKHFMLISSLLLSSAAFSQAYQWNMQGMRQLAMGGSGAAKYWDASTLFYNPGAITAAEHPSVYAGMNALMPRTRYVSSPVGTGMLDAEEQTYTPYSVYFASPVGYKTPFTAGFGIYTPYSNGINWGNDWTGRYIVQSTRFNTTFFQPTLAWQISDELSIGAGFVFASGYYQHTRALPYLDASGNEAAEELKGRATGVGYNLGVHLRAGEDVTFGLTYRSQINMKIRNGYASFTVPTSMSADFVNTSFTTTIPTPQTVTAAMAWDVNENLVLQLEANYNGWSAVDSLLIDYKENTSLLGDRSSARRYKNTVSLRAGAHYTFKNDRWAVMLGASYSPSPVRDGFLSPEMPDAQFLNASAGLSFKISNRITAIGVFQYTFSEMRSGRETEYGFRGKYHTKTINPGLALTYDFN